MESDVEVRRTSTDQLRARKFEGFQVTKLQGVLDKLAWKYPVILKGPKSTGKTLAIEQWAYANGAPFIRKSCTAETGDRQLLGGFVLRGLDESYFMLGVLAAAIDVANEVGHCVLVLEEINALNEEAQKVVNSLADYRREVDLHSIGRVFRLSDAVKAPFDGTVIEADEMDAYRVNLVISGSAGEVPFERAVPRLLLKVALGDTVKEGQLLADPAGVWVVGTMNPGYGGTYELNEDFRSRFKFIEVPFMKDEVELAILEGCLPSPPTAQEREFLRGLQALAKETRGGTSHYALSTRDLEQCIEDYLSFLDIRPALKILEFKYKAEEVKDFRARVMSTFRVNLETVNLLE